MIAIKRITKIEYGLLKELQNKFEKDRWELKHTKAFVANKNNYLLAAFINGELCGVLTAFRLQKTNKKSSEFLLYEIDTHKDYRKQGVGTALTNKLLEVAKKAGAHEVWVLTNKSNKGAMGLYQKTGGKVQNADDVMFAYELK